MRELPRLQGPGGTACRLAPLRSHTRWVVVGGIGILLVVAGGCSKPDPAPVTETATAAHAAAEPAIVSILPRAPSAMPRKDSALVETGRAIARVMASSGELWPGFAPEAILVYWPYAPMPAVLVSAKAPPDDWREVVPAKAGGTPAIYFREGSLRGLVGNMSLHYSVGDVSATAVALNTMAVGEMVDFAFHEAFHRFQQDVFASMRDGDPIIPDSLVADPEYLALQEVEYPLLRAALDEPRHARRTDILHRYLAVRRARLERVDPVVRAAERRWELIEGAAAWVGLKAATLHSPTARADHARKVRTEELRNLLPLHGQSGLYERVVRTRSSAVGAAVMVLLDDAGALWQPVAESGRSLHDLLERRVGSSPRSPEELVREAKQAAGYDTLLAMTRSWVDTLSSATAREDFERRPGFRVVVDVEPRQGAEGSMRPPTYNMVGGAGRSPDASTTVYGRVDNFSINAPDVLITARNTELMVERPASAPFRVTLILDELPSFPRLRSFRAGELNLRSTDFELKATRATANKESDSTLHVVIRR